MHNNCSSDIMIQLKSTQCVIDKDKLDLTIGCLSSFRETLVMLRKFPMNKKMKFQGVQLTSCLDDLIFYLNSIK